MDEELRELYQEIILDHNKNPKNYREIAAATHYAQGYNPLCGDKVDIYLLIEGDRIKDVSFTGSGCAISKASASIMTTVLKNKSVDAARALFDSFKSLITATADNLPDLEPYGTLAVFAGVRDYPSRVKCASLAWHTFVSALENERQEGVISTE